MDLIEPSDSGLYCRTGGFHVDPWRPVECAVITHAHSDHARAGSRRYLCSERGARLLRARLGDDIPLQTLAWGQPVRLGDATVSLHPAGHLLGSAQVRIERDGHVTVLTGDFKIEPDPTCEPWEPLPCETLISECTFGLPIYRWPDAQTVASAINAWWQANQDDGRTSILYAYALGKAQRVLAGLDPSIGPILLHGAVAKVTQCYRQEGVALPPAVYADDAAAKEHKGRALVIAPPSANGTTWGRKFAPFATALASGWMRIRGNRRRRAIDRGFILSDHADWPGLLRAIEACGPRRIGLTHGYAEPMARWLSAQGHEAFILPTRFAREGEEAEA